MFDLDSLAHLTAPLIIDLHDSILMESPGLKGAQGGKSVDALVGRIQSNLMYQPFNTIEEVAALYAEVIARGHVFNDGNKRTAVVSMLTFLDLNGYTLIVDEDQLADQIVLVADGKINYKRFAVWLRPKLVSTDI